MRAAEPTRRTLLKLGAAAPLAALLPTAAASQVMEPVCVETTVATAASVLPAWGWWAGTDCGERFNFGPYATREEAVAQGRTYWGGDAFDIIEAIQGEPDLRVDGNDLLEWIDERNEDHWDKDGDCTVFTSTISKEARTELGQAVTAVIAAWVERHGVKVNSFMFADTRNEGFIHDERPELAPTTPAPALESGARP